MEEITFRFETPKGDGPKFGLSAESLTDLNSLRSAIQSNYGVVQPEGKSGPYLSMNKTEF